MRVIFAGTPEFAAVALADLHAAGHEIVLVLSQPDRPAGRGMKLQASPVKQWAVQHGLTVAQPQGLKLDGKYAAEAAQAKAQIEAAHADVMVVAAYGLILPTWALEAPRLGCLNIHASLLPRWRGAAPIHRAIEAGDVETGITIMQMDAGLDTGDMWLTAREPIHADDTTATLHDRLAALGGRLIVQALQALDNPTAQAAAMTRTPQPSEGVTYAHKIEKAEAAIDWRSSADTIARRVRAFNPFPGASASWRSANGDVEVIKLWQAQAWSASERSTTYTQSSTLPNTSLQHPTPGTVLSADASGVRIACGEGVLCVTQLQRAGGKRLDADAFLRGFAMSPGQSLV
jgi:methionyl-tRNA formyltransferase